MERLTPEQLLMPRRKVIAPYPYSVLSVGYIITEPVPLLQAQALINAVASMDYIDQFPNIFEPTPWWMDREENQMPEFMKAEIGHSVRVTKVEKWDMSDYGWWTKINGNEVKLYIEGGDAPATQAEYDLFQQSQTKP